MFFSEDRTYPAVKAIGILYEGLGRVLSFSLDVEQI